MKKLAPITAIPVALFALTACGQSPEDEFLEGMGCEDGQTAEECGQAMADDMDPVPGSEPHRQEDSDDAVEHVDPARSSSEEFSYGSSAVFRDQDTGQDLGTFSVNYIDTAHDCNGDTVVAVEVGANTINKDDPISLDPSDFYFVDEDGETVDASPAKGCEATLEVPADSEGSELLVFDHQAEEGAIALDSEHSNAFWPF